MQFISRKFEHDTLRIDFIFLNVLKGIMKKPNSCDVKTRADKESKLLNLNSIIRKNLQLPANDVFVT